MRKFVCLLSLLLAGCATQMASKCSRWSFVESTYELKPGYVVMQKEYRCTKFREIP